VKLQRQQILGGFLIGILVLILLIARTRQLLFR